MGYKKDKASGKQILKKVGGATILETRALTPNPKQIAIENRQVVRGLELAQARLTKATSELTASQEAFDDAQELLDDFSVLNPP